MPLASVLQNLHDAVSNGQVAELTKLLTSVCSELDYVLFLPYSEVRFLKASEDAASRFWIEYKASHYTHYRSISQDSESLVFAVVFRGQGYFTTPEPPLTDLFHPGVLEELQIYAYGGQWVGTPANLPAAVIQSLELSQSTAKKIELNEFIERVNLKMTKGKSA